MIFLITVALIVCIDNPKPLQITLSCVKYYLDNSATLKALPPTELVLLQREFFFTKSHNILLTESEVFRLFMHPMY
jgi:hypothetical protein